MRAKLTKATPAPNIARRSSLKAIAGAFAGLILPSTAGAQSSGRLSFDQWIAAFGAKATAHGVTEETYARVMRGLRPDPTGLEAIRSQPEFTEQLWQYLNRRVSDWRVLTGKQKANDYDKLLSRIERDFGVDRGLMLAVWGIESSYGDPVVQERYMHPVIPSLATLAWAEPHRRAYWEQELINALIIVQNGWSMPAEMKGSWAGAMGHTQWMPEVWLHLGLDYDHDGKISPFGPPDDALATTARFFVERGKYRRGQHWGFEVRMPAGLSHAARSYAEWEKHGVVRADGQPFPEDKAKAKPWTPVPGGPTFLLGPNFYAVHNYNPSMNYTLALVHLGDRIMGGGDFIQRFPGSERTPTLAELQEIQRRLTARGFDTGGTDGRAGNDTMVAVRNFQRQNGIDPADGYAGVGLLTRLRQGS